MTCARRRWLLGTLAGLGCVASRPGAVSPASPRTNAPGESTRRRDAEQLAAFVRARASAWVDAPIDWAAARDDAIDRAAHASDDTAFVLALARMLDELADPGAGANVAVPGSWRAVPLDVWPVVERGEVVVEAVRRGSAAEAVGVRPGARILSIDGHDVRERAQARRPAHATRDDDRVAAWALLSAVTGRHGDARRIEIRDGARPRRLVLAPDLGAAPSVTHGRDDDDLGWIRIADFATTATIEAFDAALDALRDTAGLVVDVRANLGGDEAVARAIAGRLLGERRRWGARSHREGDAMSSPEPAYVSPRGPWSYEGPIVVTVDRFTIGVAEVFAAGLHGAERAEVVGTATAGRAAGLARTVLHRSRLGFHVSAEPAYHVDGRPLDGWTPGILVDPYAPAVGDRDAIDAAARVRVRRSIARDG